MTANEICELARTRQPLPEHLMLSEQQLYYTVRGIYRSYSAKELSLEQAKTAKKDAIREFESNSFSETVYLDHGRRMSAIARVLYEAEKCGCEYCKKIAKLFDGRANPYNITP